MSFFGIFYQKSVFFLYFFLCITFFGCATDQKSLNVSTLEPSVENFTQNLKFFSLDEKPVVLAWDNKRQPCSVAEKFLEPLLTSKPEVIDKRLFHLPDAYFSKKGYHQYVKNQPSLSFLHDEENHLIWPLKEIHISSHFGIRKKKFHSGIDLKAIRGTAVHAALDGVVVYAGSGVKGYGRVLILRHKNDLSTLYAHNQSLLVKKGEIVFQGQKIALSGCTGRSSGPHLHFEVRHGIHPIDTAKVALFKPDRFRLDPRSLDFCVFTKILLQVYE